MAASQFQAASRVCLVLALMWLPTRAGAQTPPDGVAKFGRQRRRNDVERFLYPGGDFAIRGIDDLVTEA